MLLDGLWPLQRPTPIGLKRYAFEKTTRIYMDVKLGKAPEYEALKATTILPIVSAYFIAVGALYLWGYWGSFGVNILEYLGLTDVVKVAAWPVGSAFVFLLVGFVLSETTPGARLPEGGGRYTPVGRWLNRHAKALGVGFMLLMIVLVTLGPPQIWLLVAVLVGVVLALPLKSFPSLVRQVPNDSIRTVLALATVVLPIYAFGQGKVNADWIRAGYKYLYVLPGSEGVAATGDIKTSLRYVGYAGNTFFFWEPTMDGVMLVPASTVKSLMLARTPKEAVSFWSQLIKRD